MNKSEAKPGRAKPAVNDVPRRRGWRVPCLVAIVLVAATIAAGWAGWTLYNRFHRGGIRNVVLISIDTCRVDHLSCYGYKRQTTPNIDAVAREGVLFKNALTPVPLTTPAHSSMLTGTYPPTHGVRLNNGERLADSNVTLAETLRDAGYQTAAFVGGFPLDARFGLDQGFDTYDCQFTRKNEKSSSGEERSAEEVNRPALNWLDAHVGNPFFLFLHYYDPHLPYAPPLPFASDYADHRYAGEIAYVDHCIGQVTARLRGLGMYDNTLLIITGDHGEDLGEHGESSHGYFVYQSTLHVPLVILVPQGCRGRQVAGNVSLVDIMPTVLDLADLKTPVQVEGVSLRRCLEGATRLGRGGTEPDRQQPIYCESLTAATFECSPLNGIVEGALKYIRAPRPELYDLETDPGEKRNVVEEDAWVALRLRGRLELMMQKMKAVDSRCSRQAVDPETVKRLQSLGYVGGGATPSDSAFDPTLKDPKDFLSTYNHTEAAHALFVMNQHEQAEKECLAILARRPNTIVAHNLLGKIALERHRWGEAKQHFAAILSILEDPKHVSKQIPIAAANHRKAVSHRDLGAALVLEGSVDEAADEFEKALRIDPHMPETHNDFGNVLQQTGKIAEAIGHYEQALALNQQMPDTHYNLGRALVQVGKLREAIGHYEQALRIKPDYADTNPNLLPALTAARAAVSAIERYEQALRVKPDDPETRNNLGNVLRQIGRVPEAIGQFEQALRIKPDNAELHYNLALALEHTGKLPEAVGHYIQAVRLNADLPVALNNLAWIRATSDDAKLRDGVEAVRLAERACQLTGRSQFPPLDTLAAAYAEAGRFDEAVATAQEAIALARSAKQENAAAQIEAHLALYRVGKPCCQTSRAMPASAVQ